MYGVQKDADANAPSPGVGDRQPRLPARDPPTSVGNTNRLSLEASPTASKWISLANIPPDSHHFTGRNRPFHNASGILELRADSQPLLYRVNKNLYPPKVSPPTKY